jgi:hypothetical protein
VRRFLLCLALLSSGIVLADGDSPKKESLEVLPGIPVTLSSNGSDVRKVLYELFTAAKKNFVCDLKTYQPLYFSLSQVDFEEALLLICQVASLRYKLQDDIYYISPLPKANTPFKSKMASKEGKTASSVVTPQMKIVSHESPSPVLVHKKLSREVLQRNITMRLTKAKLANVFSELGRQAKVSIEVDSTVPSYTVDAVLVNTSLRQALDLLSKKTGLAYEFTTQGTIRVRKVQKV